MRSSSRSLTSVVNATPGCFTPGKEIQYPLYRKLGGPQCRSGRVRKISLASGFYPRTFQPIVCFCIDWALQAHRLQHDRWQIDWWDTGTFLQPAVLVILWREFTNFKFRGHKRENVWGTFDFAEIWGSGSGIYDNSSLLHYRALSIGQSLLTYRKLVMSMFTEPQSLTLQ